MNKPVALICAAISVSGLLILCTCTYFALVYGHGDPEAGNFHRCVYTSERDPQTGLIRRDWDTRWELVSSTDGSALAATIDMWFLGLFLSVLGPGIYALEDRTFGARHAC